MTSAPLPQEESGPVRLNEKASTLAARGRPWFYADDLVAGQPSAPCLVRVVNAKGRDLGLAFYSPASKIRLRRCGPWKGDAVPDAESFFALRLAEALAARETMADADGAVRLVHGEGDGLPGLVVDRYADCLVLQSTSAVIENNLGSIVPFLADASGARAVIARNDVGVRKLEGLHREVRLLHGKRVETVWFREHGVAHQVDLFTGQKTGFFLDQRPARLRVQQLAAEREGAAVLDLFCYQGGFSLAALSGGAGSALAVDQSKHALERAGAAAEKNGLAGLRTEAGNAFDVLRRLRDGSEQFDLIILDPPAFAKSRRELDGARRGYRDLNRSALRLLRPGGFLLTCSCSHHVDLPMFERMLRQAAADLPFRILLRERLTAGFDHPIWLNLPESEYLKSLLLQRAP